MSDQHDKRAKEILQKIIYATLATVTKDGAPWNSPVRHCFDKEMNIYWFSDKEGQHSRNVRENGKVFIVIYDSTVPEGKGEGVFFEATAEEVNNPEEIRHARRIKKGEGKDAPNDFMGSAIRRVYKATPTRVWMNDAQIENGVFIKDYRVEVSLNILKGLVSP
jgi:nitroimidazol reductase NimA-like FMN-containing flavoprotein (pyridoxamine 5'-phosphate oxidase superfamily)